MINILKEIAINAGEILKDGYHEKKDIKYKGLIDLVTNYDIKCEEFIITSLKDKFIDYELIGEESFNPNLNFSKSKVIYIDPIDGTTNFVHNIPHFSISIGVWENSIPIMAVVYNPILDEMFWAVAGGGAYCNNKKLQVSEQTTLQQSLIGTGFPYAKVNRGVEYKWVIESMTNLLPNIRDIRRLGSASLDLCYLAEGKTDAFYEIDLKPWDIAGGILILLEAGGKVTNLSNNRFDFSDKVIVASNSKIHKELLSYLDEV
ncbi:Inositol-1-monophosphatase [hydrothermal vent metagenome]|uniref:inositol-phosphate phosphatase n=1 Tax=hydrothermal vent metagenome TaxID=652676 RepID=A0A1W1BFN3_9ZZZZ